MLIKKHEIKINDVTFMWIIVGDKKIFSATKKVEEITDKTLITLCKVLGAEFDCLFDGNGKAKKILTAEDRFLILEDFSTAEDIWSEKEAGSNDWWKVFHSI